MLALLLAAAGRAQEPAPPQGAFEQAFAVLERHCVRCHGPERQKGGLRLDALDPDLVRGADAGRWHAVLEMVRDAKMPPEGEPPPEDGERRLLVAWLTGALDAAARARQDERRTVLRRLNRQQYTHTLQDLLSLPIDFGRVLPEDGRSRSGFSNDGEVLRASPLHLEYYREIARRALAEAIVTGERPEPVRYLVRFGKGIGRGRVAGRTGGYQSVPLDPADFTVDVLDGQGRPRRGATADERRALDAVRRRISVGLRGSSQDRFRVVDEGIILYGALPHREEVPQAWQGPSPNLKLELQRCFPESGPLAMRVRASRGWIPTAWRELLVALDDTPPQAVLGAGGADGADGRPLAPAGALVLAAGESDQRVNVRLDGDVLSAIDVPRPSSARLSFELADDGYYQIDLVHPVVEAAAMPSVRLTVDGRHLDMRPAQPPAPAAGEPAPRRMVSVLGGASLRAGRHELQVGGPFFVGFSHVVVARLPDDHAFVRRSTAAVEELTARVAGTLPAIRPLVGTRTDDGMDYATFAAPREVTAPPGEPATHTFHARLENLPVPEPDSGDPEELSGILLIGLWNDHLVTSRDHTGPPLLVESIEVEAPFHPVWPPRSHTAILFASPDRGDEPVYVRKVLARFLERAFRRPVREREVERYHRFWREVRGGCDSFEASIREVLVAVLCSPAFLYFAVPETLAGGHSGEGDAGEGDAGGTLSEHALAARLSYFLWHSPPDHRLRELAREGRLRQRLPEQVDRMLDDPRVERFVRAFTRQWLRLDRLDQVAIDVARHPAFTRFVRRDLGEETWRFVHELLRRDAELFALIDADFVMVDRNLAAFYGIGGVDGVRFRPVPAPPERRGGLLVHGSFLAGHSDGREPHAIRRAVWLADRLLGQPPPPPPPNVPDLDPDTPGFEKLTLQQQLAVHRDHDSCRDCHRGIDPFGIPFEHYGAAGLREERRRGRPIDAASTLPDGTVVDGVEDLRRWILTARRDEFAAALVEHLFAWALGREVHFGDAADLAAICELAAADGHGLRSVVRRIVESPAFLRP